MPLQCYRRVDAILTASADNWRNLAAAYDAFMRDAGVDQAFTDDPRDWLGEARAKADQRRSATDVAPAPAPPILAPARPIGPAPAAPVRVERDGWPETLAEFAPWWLSHPPLDSGPLASRVAPRGQAGSLVMVIVAEPETQDGETLLSGPQGALFDAIERAMGLAPGAAYRASVLVRHTPAADWSALAEAGMGAVLRHHVALARPQRLLVLSREALRLLAPDDLGADGTGSLALDSGQVPLIAAYPLAQMAARPGYKRIFWQRWLAFAKGA